ncbi:hypothetical protein BDP27DRAFT_1371524 [Rhodocollybia butyracea]|uniref:Uncharacterized protein n=1 Tax=Rhodocollybia butyracea TaxID=206335 RepID=A0A9P5PA61_9AGAR|nr:hypothetical protein BDP27DRAFT_1371524 [Rhodocollybia butyracea]
MRSTNVVTTFTLIKLFNSVIQADFFWYGNWKQKASSLVDGHFFGLRQVRIQNRNSVTFSLRLVVLLAIPLGFFFETFPQNSSTVKLQWTSIILIDSMTRRNPKDAKWYAILARYEHGWNYFVRWTPRRRRIDSHLYRSLARLQL